MPHDPRRYPSSKRRRAHPPGRPHSARWVPGRRVVTSYSARRAGARNGARLSEQAIREALARTAAAEAVRQEHLKQARAADRAAEKARPKLTAEDVADAVVVRDSIGWHRVVSVNAKSVTVTTPYSWTDRIPLDRVLEARSS